ncbi:MAG TPA: hypothetical protein VFJ97_11615 [Dermatophilaceae bacterium]|nr:hypothetical protein [Dermatophilaceae bacterium]
MTPGRRRRRWPGRVLLLLLLVAVLGGAYFGVSGMVRNFGGPMCRAVALGNEVRFDPEQTANAATITAVALRRGLPARAATIALATAIQESDLRNVGYGDRDSLGLFQQRPSQGWGTAAQVRDPVYSAGKFYDALVKIANYESRNITEVAQQVQRSAYPEAYADHEQEGRVLASTLAGHSPGGIGCRLDRATSAGAPAAVVSGLKRELAVAGAVSSGRVVATARSEQLAWAAGAWTVAHGAQHGVTSVTVGSRTWTRTRDEAGWSWSPAPTPAPTPRTVVVTFA